MWKELSGVHDGSITFSTALDNAQLEKDLAALTKKIETKEKSVEKIAQSLDKAKESAVKMADRVSGIRAERAPFAEQLNDVTTKAGEVSLKIKGLKDQLAEAQTALGPEHSQGFDLPFEKFLQYQDTVSNLPKEIAEQEKEYEKLNKEFDRLVKKVNDYDGKINQATTTLNEENDVIKNLTAQLGEQTAKLSLQKTEAGGLVQRLDKANSGAAQMAGAVNQAGAYMDRFTARVKKLASRVFVFTMITTALRGMRNLMGKVIRTNSEARQSIAQLKGALLTLAQPLVEIIIPAFTMLVNVLARVVTVVAQLISALFGKTLKQSRDGAKSLYNEANAIEGVGAAAKEAAGSLAGFDEINTIDTSTSTGGGSGGGASMDIVPDFSWTDDMGGMLDRLKEIADLVGMVAAGLALWKISGILPGVLGTIAEKLAGILLTVGGLLLYWNGLADAWENGVDWLNLIEMIGGLAAAALGLYLLLGPIAAGIALIVGGLGMLVTGFHDAMENGWNLQNVLLSIAGLLATGLGIALLTGSWIPLLIAAIASILLALTVATGHGEELLDGIREVIEGFKDFFVGVVTGDMEKAIGGIGKIFEGLKKTVFAVIDGVKDTFLSFLTWLDEKTGGKFHGIIEFAKGLIEGFFNGFIKGTIETIKLDIENFFGAIEEMFGGFLDFLGGIVTPDLKRIGEGIVKMFDGFARLVAAPILHLINSVIDILNVFIAGLNRLKFDFPDWIPGLGGKRFGLNLKPLEKAKIPALAQGAVIPPNREFMAVLGDQRSGYNVEAPADLIRQMVIEGIQAAGISGGSGGDIHITVELDGKVVARNTVHHINDMTRQAGKPVLLI